MSSEQPLAEQQVETAPAPQVDITQQATNPTPTTERKKNPKRVAAGKATAEKTRNAREQQKKELAEAREIIANKNAKDGASPSSPEKEPEPKEESGLTVNQWIGIGGVVVSAAGLFLKRQEIMAAVKKNLPSPPPPPVEPALPPVEPRRVIRKMD